MCNGYGAAFGYLLFEDRYDWAIGAEHVSEADSYKVRFAGSVEVLNIHFRNSLWRAHYAGWIDGFIGAYHYKVCSAETVCGVSDDLGADDIVPDCLAGVKLHQRYVLMSGGVNDDLRFVVFKNFVHTGTVGNVANNRFYGDGGKLFVQFLFYVEQGIFGLLDK